MPKTLEKMIVYLRGGQPYGIHTSHLYQVRLFPVGCDFPTFTAWLGGWVQHLQEKSWVTPDDLWNFVESAQEIYRG